MPESLQGSDKGQVLDAVRLEVRVAGVVGKR